LRAASGKTTSGKALLRRALLLFSAGELQELHGMWTRLDDTQGTCDFIASMLEANVADARDAPVSRALASLRIIKVNKVTLPTAVIQRCAASLTELECHQIGYVATDSVLPRCTQLESLSLHNWNGCPPAAWLGLSQLHTLRGVNLCDVPAVAIAAALPRLHTLHLKHDRGITFSVSAFYDELLPRLRSFHLDGLWRKTDEETADVLPLPLLEDLNWSGWSAHLPRQLKGARPSTLNTFDVDLIEWSQAFVDAGPTAAPPLVRVRALTLRLGGTPPEAAFMAGLLRQAPQLRQLAFYVQSRAHARWVLSEEFTSEPAFAGLVHLRHVAISSEHPLCLPVPDGYGVRLRQRHFPNLRRLTVGDEEYPV
jgi:hypothetical protein